MAKNRSFLAILTKSSKMVKIIKNRHFYLKVKNQKKGQKSIKKRVKKRRFLGPKIDQNRRGPKIDPDFTKETLLIGGSKTGLLKKFYTRFRVSATCGVPFWTLFWTPFPPKSLLTTFPKRVIFRKNGHFNGKSR